MVDLEDQFRKGSSSYVSHIINLYQNGNMTQNGLLFYFAVLLSCSQSTTLFHPVKIPELRLFTKIKDRLAESLEAAFGDAAEKENKEVVERLLDAPKFQTLLQAIMHLAEIVRIMEIKLNLMKKLNINEFDKSEEELFSAYKQLVLDFKDTDPLLSEALDGKSVTCSHITWDANSEKIEVPNLADNIGTLSEIFRTKTLDSKSCCAVTNLPLFVFNNEMKYCI